MLYPHLQLVRSPWIDGFWVPKCYPQPRQSEAAPAPAGAAAPAGRSLAIDLSIYWCYEYIEYMVFHRHFFLKINFLWLNWMIFKSWIYVVFRAFCPQSKGNPNIRRSLLRGQEPVWFCSQRIFILLLRMRTDFLTSTLLLCGLSCFAVPTFV